MAREDDMAEHAPLLGCGEWSDCTKVPVYPLIHEIRVDIVAHIDTPLTYDQLVAPDSTYTIIRPLTDKYLGMRNPSVVFSLLLNKVQFTTDSNQLSIATLSQSRAQLCEILAIRVLRGWSERSLYLATVLLTPWPIFQGATSEVIRGAKEDGEEEVLDDTGTALEMAIISTSKRFIRSPSCQKVIEGIWTGKIVYTSINEHALIQDNYKKRPIQLYNPHKAPLLDHYRLKVPKIRAILEYANFLILFILYVLAIEHMELERMHGFEGMFIVYALAFSLDKSAAIREHGLKVFASSLVNGFDLLFVIIFGIYLGARSFGFYAHNAWALEFGVDLLAIGACLMFPRLAFMTLANNLMILSIRSMFVEFCFLMCVGMFCFLGFVYAFRTLGQGYQPVSQICWWLLEIYFGLDATGFESAHHFHPYFGPILMVIYGFLSNTLLLTVSVSVLGNTFATINADAPAESMFRRAVATIEGVKADSVFSYQLPFNLIAVAVLYPLSFVLNPRWFHKVNVVMIRATNFPVLLVIALWERQTYNQQTLWEQFCDFADHYLGRLTAATEGFVGSRIDVSAVFEIEREFGTYYSGWDDDVFDDDEDFNPNGDEELDAGLTGSGKITLSPESETFPSASVEGSPHVSHRRRSSMGNLSRSANPPHLHHSHMYPHAGPLPSGANSPIPHVAPLPRVRRNSTLYGPSPLAAIYTRGDDFYQPQRARALGVGSMPVTSVLNRSNSPRRGRPPPSAISSSVSASSLASVEGRVKFSSRPSILPIAEAATPVAQPSTPSAEQVAEGAAPAPADDGSAVKNDSRKTFPESNEPRARAISFQDPPTLKLQPSEDVKSPKPDPKPLGDTKPHIETTPERFPAECMRDPDSASSSKKDSPISKKEVKDKQSNRCAPKRPESSVMLRPDVSRNSSSRSTTATPMPKSSPHLKPSGTKPKTASELLESMEHHTHGDSHHANTTSMEAQLASVEARQERIEDLLEQLIANTTSKRGVSICRKKEEEHDTFDEDMDKDASI